MTTRFIEEDGKRTFAVVPIDLYERMLDALDDVASSPPRLALINDNWTCSFNFRPRGIDLILWKALK